MSSSAVTPEGLGPIATYLECKLGSELTSLSATSSVLTGPEIDYTEVTGKKWDSMKSEDYVAMMSSQGFVGDPLIDTQHFLGGSKYLRTAENAISGDWQLRAAHQRYTGPDKKIVEAKGHGHAVIRHHYRREDGEWKLCGLKPTVRWNEFDFDKIFKGEA
ncbi:Pituitary homeobox 2 [Oleoguttula sp. CCFEE 5521]